MDRAKPSGYALTKNDVAIVLGMQARGDRNHDIAAWFGVNQGRVKQAKDGEYGNAMAAPENLLPPKGPPGIKGRRLREAVKLALAALDAGGADAAGKAQTLLRAGAEAFDARET